MILIVQIALFVIVWEGIGWAAYLTGLSADFYESDGLRGFHTKTSRKDHVIYALLVGALGPLLWIIAIMDLVKQPKGRRLIGKYGVIIGPHDAAHKLKLIRQEQ